MQDHDRIHPATAGHPAQENQEMNVPPVSVRYLPADRYNPAHWQVQHCPFCGKRHLHGADSPRYGIPAKDSLGSRFAHCISGELYELVPDLNHRPTRAALDNTQ